MANTSKLISSVSYNTPAFLAGKLRDLQQQGIIEYAHWIWHTPEEDEKKEHAHLVLQPNKRLDTEALRNLFVELVPGEELPRKLMPFKPSKMRDWMLYAVHDRAYLLAKGQERQFAYTKDDLQTTEPDLLNDDWRDCHAGENRLVTQVIELASKGLDWRDVIKLGIIPINQLFQYREIFANFYTPKTDRNGKGGHDENI